MRGGFEGTAEVDNGVDGDEQGAGRGQLMVGYRVVDGSVGPASFISQDGQLTMSRNPEYTAALTKTFPPAAGFRWEGYLSSETQFNPDIAGDRTTSLRPEFSLPSRGDGAPFAGPYQWRPMVGFRATGPGNAQASDKLDCNNTNHTLCFDSPGFSGGVGGDLTKAVSDFGVLPGLGHGRGRRGGDRRLLRAQRRRRQPRRPHAFACPRPPLCPGDRSSPRQRCRCRHNGSAATSVSLAVPPGTPAGDYTVTLTGTTNAGVNGTPLTRSNTGTITVLAPPPPAPAPAPAGAPPAPAAATPTAPPVIPTPPSRIAVTIAFDFPSAKQSTTFTLLQVKGAPSGATVEVRARCPKCPAKSSLKKHNAPRVLSLKPWLRKPLRAGTVLTVTVTKPGTFGMVKTFKVRANKRPSISERCLAPDSRSRASCQT